MEVVDWEPNRLLGVKHEGWPIRGLAWFELRETNDGATLIEWAEELDPPLGPHGELGGVILRRPIERVLRKSAMKLKRLAEAS